MTPYRENIGPLCALDYDAFLKKDILKYLNFITIILYIYVDNIYKIFPSILS